MSAEWNAPRLPLEALGIGPFHLGVNNMTDIPAFYPQGNNTGNMNLPGYSGNISNSNSIVSTVSDSSGSRHMVRDPSAAIFVDSMPELSGMHNSDGGVAVDWSPSEQQLLQEGLVKYADEPSIMKYIKIAAMLRDKTVRDVALRCKWMTGKRRKQHELHVRKGTCRKDKLVESQSRSSLSPTMQDAAGYSFSAPRMEQRERPCGALTLKASQLLDQNRQVLDHIDANLAAMQPQKNKALISCSRKFFEEISAILKEMPGGINQLPVLPPLYSQEHSSVDPTSVQRSMYYPPNFLDRQQGKRDPPSDGLSDGSTMQTCTNFPSVNS